MCQDMLRSLFDCQSHVPDTRSCRLSCLLTWITIACPNPCPSRGGLQEDLHEGLHVVIVAGEAEISPKTPKMMIKQRRPDLLQVPGM